jgi:hypothetical protein
MYVCGHMSCMICVYMVHVPHVHDICVVRTHVNVAVVCEGQMCHVCGVYRFKVEVSFVPLKRQR